MQRSPRPLVRLLAAAALCCAPVLWAAGPRSASSCQTETVRGEVHRGQAFTQAIGNGLVFALDPVASGWIVRVRPLDAAAQAELAGHDYAELATPPYRSVTPLSISTDFAFRAQDAVAWNPRRFRFAVDAPAFTRLLEAYQRLTEAGATPPATFQVELSHEIAQAAGAVLTIEDARLVAGSADQTKAAATVASHFDTTAHTLLEAGPGSASALGALDWIRFRVDFELPAGFAVNRKLYPHVHVCQAR